MANTEEGELFLIPVELLNFDTSTKSLIILDSRILTVTFDSSALTNVPDFKSSLSCLQFGI